VVRWIFAQRLAGHSVARIARALNEAGIPCPSAADPGRNPHRTATAWTLGAVTTILGNPRYTGHQVWNRQRTDQDLADPGNISLGHRQVQRWNLPDGWIISKKPAHRALVSEADFIAAQNVNAARGPARRTLPATPQKRCYLLAGLLACGICGRRTESAWSNGKPAYRCRHGHTSAMDRHAQNIRLIERPALVHRSSVEALSLGRSERTVRWRPIHGVNEQAAGFPLLSSMVCGGTGILVVVAGASC
jgi:site-specific DNA recombinase